MSKAIVPTQRGVGAWNMLPELVEEGDDMMVFKTHLDRLVNRRGWNDLAHVLADFINFN